MRSSGIAWAGGAVTFLVVLMAGRFALDLGWPAALSGAVLLGGVTGIALVAAPTLPAWSGRALMRLFVVLGIGSAALGIWFLTTPDPGTPGFVSWIPVVNAAVYFAIAAHLRQQRDSAEAG